MCSNPRGRCAARNPAVSIGRVVAMFRSPLRLIDSLMLVKSRRYWDRIAHSHATPAEQVVRHQTDQEIAAAGAQLAERLGIGPGDALLEVGCGNGLIHDSLRRAAGRATGLDLSPALAEKARALTGLEIRLGEAAHLPWDEATFTVIVCEEVSQHFPSKGYLVDAVTEFVRVLRPGGRAWLGMVRAPSDRNRTHGRSVGPHRQVMARLYERLSGVGLWNGYFEPSVIKSAAGRLGCECQITFERSGEHGDLFDALIVKSASSASN